MTAVSGRKIHNPRQFGKVAVLMGGQSAERDISLKSGTAVLDALVDEGVDAHGIDAGPHIARELEQGRYDRALIMLHGRGGEDGMIQGALETMGLPYSGSGVLGSSLAMDKIRAKYLWQSHGLPTPPFVELGGAKDITAQCSGLEFPLIVKPVHEGSSFGMTKVTDASQLVSAWRDAASFDQGVMAERWITGHEYTAGILGRQVLPLIRIETPRTFYDFKAKYDTDDTRYLCPCGLDEETEARLQSMSLRAFDVLGCSGWGRVDFMCDDDGDPWLLEVNTVPGMTTHSLFPKAALRAGMDFNEMVWRILETSMVESEGAAARGGGTDDAAAPADPECVDHSVQR